MDFFDAQARAKKRTARLVALFALAVAGTILAGYFVALLASRSTQNSHGFVLGRLLVAGAYRDPTEADSLWQPQIFAVVSLGTLLVVGLGSLYKWHEFSGGGAAVAEGVGARHLEPGSADPKERRLLNVVEEMAIAAGIPMPAVYVLDDEDGINAFAAGLTTGDAVVTVSRGALDRLSRDELQGVIGHEFSHILNGDMRLNLRLTAIIFGILVIGLAGRGILWSLRGVRVSSRDKQASGGIVIMIALLGVALLVLGYVGYFFGRLIQAAISRQREFLADAYSVQFTRNPAGITGALKKIGGYAAGSALTGHDTAQINHFFFAQSFRSNFGGLWATHPPVAERIRAVDPQWDGKMFDPPRVSDPVLAALGGRSEMRGLGPMGGMTGPALAGLAVAVGEVPARQSKIENPKSKIPPPAYRPAAVMANAGALTAGHFRHAQQLLDGLPPALRAAARDPARAPALVCGLLLADDPAVRRQQLELVAQHAGAETAAALTQLLVASKSGSAEGVETAPEAGAGLATEEARLPLLQLAMPALRTLDVVPLEALLQTLDELVRAAGEVTPFEFALQKMLARQLSLASSPGHRVDFYSFDGVARDIAVVLSTFARVGNADEVTVAAAFAAGAGQLRQIQGALALLPPEACGLAALDTAFDRLAAASPIIKQRTLLAAAQVIGADGVVTVQEGELHRALAAALDVPIPLGGVA